MPESKGQQRSELGTSYAHNLLLAVACPKEPTSLSPGANLCKSRVGESSLQESQDFESRQSSRMSEDKSLFSCTSVQSNKKCRRSTSSTSYAVRKKLISRSFQVFSLIVVGISMYALVENVKYLIQSYDGDPAKPSRDIDKDFVNINEALQSWVIPKQDASQVQTSSSKSTSMKVSVNAKSVDSDIPVSQKPVDVNNISFLINNDSMCASSKKTEFQRIYFMVIVHSAPQHFEARQSIRSSWGSQKFIRNSAMRLVFITGRLEKEDPNAELVENAIRRESEIFGDIVMGDFIDSYRNLSYKHLLGYKWVVNYCPNSSFVLKADDDAFVDIYQLHDFLSETYGNPFGSEYLICNVFPEGSKPIRQYFSQGQKWAVTVDEYPHPVYPRYCGGLAYLATPNVIKKILDVSGKVKFFWIDDVFVTGVLRELAEIEPFYLNLRYAYDEQKYRKILEDHKNRTVSSKIKHGLARLPFMIAHIEHGPRLLEEMHSLWEIASQTK